MFIDPHVSGSIKCNNLLNICVNCINKLKVIKFYCWLGKQKGLFSAQCRCRSPNSNPTIHSVVWEGKVANHGVSFDTQQAMGYIAKLWAENSKEDKNLITESNKINKLKLLEVNNKFVIRICEKTESIRSKTLAILLLRQNIESNPGPENDTKSNVVVRTYNCNGLGNINKFRRLLIKLKPEVQHGGIA